ncbi:uncharacterized protein LOC103386930 isoform X2 [Cynoglossus semilaevis]|uniref:Uncharacterized LOC103386930 n=1 Tax=Cynoglossus semilaevis TaxID=244447 RepID=A0A3P8UM48_CYNSE|nr:uncharacterized protein LOC103386930 isoform X2 [Cynoglossus semilaevis]
MALDHSVLLLIAIITGSYTSSKVTQVSVKVGSSITIPCVYREEYRNHVKYLCRGFQWSSCTDVVKTNRPDQSGKFSIFDDKSQRVFNMTIGDVTKHDTDYWCIVEKSGTDDGAYFHLSVTDGTPALYVDDQEVQGFLGGDITIRCYHSTSSGEVGWCKLGGTCVKDGWGTIDGRRVSVNSSVPRVFTATLYNVTIQSSGWYLCFKGDLQMPVYVNVTDRPITTTCLSPTTTIESGKISSSSWYLVTLLIPLGLLVFAVIVAVIVWFMLKKHSSSNPQTSAMAQRPSESSQDVTYSSVVIKKPQKAKEVELSNDTVTYSTLKEYKTSS